MPKEIFKCAWCGKEVKRRGKKYGGIEVKNHFCNNECKGLWQKQKREDLGYTKEWLYEQYVVEKRTANDIAKEVGRDSKRVWEWIRDYGIETRKRGFGDRDVWFVKGQESAFKGKKHSEENKERQRNRMLKDGRVPYLVNGQHWLKQDGAHPASWKGGVTPERQAIYSSEQWKEAVKEVWRREDATCQRCGKRQNEERDSKFHLHHLYSFADYPNLRVNPDNLVLLCKECHLFVHSKKNTNHEFMLKEAELPEWTGGTNNG